MERTTYADEKAPTDDHISGPIHEFDKFDRPTGATYFRCRLCGREAMRRGDLDGHPCEAER